jgi:signal transduction histidine kinase
VLEDVATALVGLGEVAVDADPAVTAQADPERLHQMAMSLAAAVLNASPGHPEVQLTAAADHDEVRLTVAGTGPLVDGAFEEEGTAGLGLHVTRELARAQGGDVRGEDNRRFVLTLPIASPPAHG